MPVVMLVDVVGTTEVEIFVDVTVEPVDALELVTTVAVVATDVVCLVVRPLVAVVDLVTGLVEVVDRLAVTTVEEAVKGWVDVANDEVLPLLVAAVVPAEDSDVVALVVVEARVEVSTVVLLGLVV